jgi:LuxR family maltose regulon positive regulatory protein
MSGALPILGAVERAGLFLEPLDGAGEWFRYHALFAGAVQQEARRQLSDEVLRAVAHKASLWYEQHDLPAEAIEAALQAGDMTRAAGLIERMSGRQPLPEMQELHTLRRWLEQIPDAVLWQHPALCLTYATALLFISLGDRSAPPTMAQLDAALQVAEQGLRAAGDTPRLGAVFACWALVARPQGEPVQAVAWARQALAQLPAEALAWRSISVNIEGLEAHRAGQLDVARQRLLEARALCETMGNRAFMRPLLGMLSAVSFEQGELHQAAAYGRQMLAEAREIGDPDAIAHAQLGLAPISYEWHELDAAQREAEAALGYARFGAQGQDIGAAVTIRLGADHADVVAGIHLPGVLAFPPQDRPLSAEGQAFLARQERWRSGEGG